MFWGFSFVSIRRVLDNGCLLPAEESSETTTALLAWVGSSSIDGSGLEGGGQGESGLQMDGPTLLTEQSSFRKYYPAALRSLIRE